ncbi:MAG TPA: 16S rRNA (adenine(1518)-N(6)/adenine(1519)-N(6))-dimethyltransferase RsmA [Candidatus Paceibacterota bacterium]|nr:16S rRNA (adenine(1518)-N(6)/adenine(1519)-N(6))-dimethyltransferase RsmA [Candidatus Paceibacterota bacterium]HRZ29812.1 16S rRNA (adenine(1518)-N(6)/adenine(1519)-N(6))-dimethyltransferase RsmA [Candidatus Paceibacterota bacterium]
MTNIKAKKSLGQNFLINQTILEKIANVSDITKADTILEIGPGTGNLTEKLLKTSAKIIAVEKDLRLEKTLNQRFETFKNFNLIFGDIRSIYPEFVKNQKSNFKVVANIPYYLSSFLFRLFFELSPKPAVITLLIQKELAERISKNNVLNNKLRMYTSLYFDSKYIETVKKTNFKPQPKVDSAIIKLTYKNVKYPKSFLTKFENIINAGFQQPRKMLISNLKHYYNSSIDYLSIFEDLNIDIKSRPEQLSFETWLELINKLN